MSLRSIKEAFQGAREKSKLIDEMNQWFLELDFEQKEKVFKQTSSEKGFCCVCGVQVNKNFVYCKEHYPKKQGGLN